MTLPALRPAAPIRPADRYRGDVTAGHMPELNGRPSRDDDDSPTSPARPRLAGFGLTVVRMLTVATVGGAFAGAVAGSILPVLGSLVAVTPGVVLGLEIGAATSAVLAIVVALRPSGSRLARCTIAAVPASLVVAVQINNVRPALALPQTSDDWVLLMYWGVLPVVLALAIGVEAGPWCLSAWQPANRWRFPLIRAGIACLAFPACVLILATAVSILAHPLSS